MEEQKISTRCCVVGGGPAGMMTGLLMARAGVPVVVLEKHGDFLRDFRGDTVHPSTLELLHELGLKERFDALPQRRVGQLKIWADGHLVPFADFRHLRPFPYLSLVPQWDFLDFLVREARKYPHFDLRMNCDVEDIVREGGRLRALKARTSNGTLRIDADLTIACDGRHSTVRRRLGLPQKALGAPMDVLWFRLPRREADPEDTFAIPGRGRFLVLINRNDYWQIAYVAPKGQARQIQSRPITEFRDDVARRVPWLADRVPQIGADSLKQLEVCVDRLLRWHDPGVLLIGDAAHAMSPVGGVGINLAIQDAVAAANVLAPALRAGGVLPDESLLARVQARRELPTKLTQTIQLMFQRTLVARAMAENGQGAFKMPAPLRALLSTQLGRSVPARIFGIGFRREHLAVAN